MREEALTWATTVDSQDPPADYYCPTRDIADGRLPKLYLAAQQTGFSDQQAALLAAMAGELAANCFDHNLGAWRDITGCWFEYSASANCMTIDIADRGQGILGSLQRVEQSLKTHRDALITAVTKEISGRAPERRGHGLKFIIASLNDGMAGARFILHTGDARLDITAPADPKAIAYNVNTADTAVNGTYAMLSIPLP